MIRYDDMSAMARALRPRSAAPFHKDAPWYRFACVGSEQQCGRTSAPGGAD
jgi:hypothetical protein